jgi:hypothetical protein
MAMDGFYRKLSDAKLRAAYETIKQNIADNILVDGMTKEKGLILNVAKERGLDLDENSISAMIETTKGHIEFFQDRGKPPFGGER